MSARLVRSAIVSMMALTAMSCGPDLTGRVPGPQQGATEPSPRVAPDLRGLPLDAGWPEPDGELKVDDLAKPVDVARCGARTFPMPKAVGFRGVGLRGPEDYRSRQVFVYPTNADADAAIESIKSNSCALADPTGQPEIRPVQKVTEEGAPPQRRLTVRSWFTYEGSDAIGAASAIAIQRGRMVVVSTRSNEGSGSAGADTLVDEDAAALASIASELERLE